MIVAPTAAPRAASLPPGALGDFDWLRGLAATLVLAGHVRGLFFVDYADLPNPTRVARLAYMITGVGHQAVVVFFVLSGFFISHGLLAARAAGRFRLSDYALRRFTRIYVVLIPALLTTWLLDQLGMFLFGTAQNIYGGQVQAPFLELPFIPDSLRLGVLLQNLLQLQHIVGFPEYGTNGPLWSLSYEVWAYAIFPLGVLALARPLRLLNVLYATVAVGLLVVGGSRLWLYFAVWLLGTGVAWWWQRVPRDESQTRRSWGAVVVALGLFAVALVVARGKLLGLRGIEDMAVGVTTAALLATLLLRPGAWRAGPTARFGTWLAGFSYSIYLFHKPAVAFLHAALLGPDRWTPSAASVLIATAITFGVLLLWCYPLSWITERHTDRIRRWATRMRPVSIRNAESAP